MHGLQNIKIRYSLNRRIGGPHSRRWNFEKISCPCKDSNSGSSSVYLSYHYAVTAHMGRIKELHRVESAGLITACISHSNSSTCTTVQAGVRRGSVRNEDTASFRSMVSNAIAIFISNGNRNITTCLSRF